MIDYYEREQAVQALVAAIEEAFDRSRWTELTRRNVEIAMERIKKAHGIE